MEEDYKYGLVKQHSGIWKSLREDGDFDEEDVWSVLKEETPAGGGALNPKGKVPSNIVPPPQKPTLQASSRIMIPRPNSTNNFINSANKSTSSIHESNNNKVIQQSAPVNIPDWSKIYRVPKNVPRLDDTFYGDGGVLNYGSDEEFEEDDDDDGDEYYDCPRLPPHEFIARRLARSQISSFSVLEGVGRTLKGRDLSKVRNAVLSKTGFLESL